MEGLLVSIDQKKSTFFWFLVEQKTCWLIVRVKAEITQDIVSLNALQFANINIDVQNYANNLLQ